jgi:hypothetical protein
MELRKLINGLIGGNEGDLNAYRWLRKLYAEQDALNVVDASLFWEAIEHHGPPHEYWMSGGVPEAKTFSNLPETPEQKGIEAKVEREQLSNYIKEHDLT